MRNLQAPPYGSNSLSPQYGGGQTVGNSPQAAASPHLTASPQVPSPQGQTLDLSVNRLHRYALILILFDILKKTRENRKTSKCCFFSKKNT